MMDEKHLKIPDLIRVERKGRRLCIYVDGEMLPIPTDGGAEVSTHAQLYQLPGITVRLVANRVELVDDPDFYKPES